MRDSNFNKIVLVAALVLAAILMMSSCASQARYPHDGDCVLLEPNPHDEGCVLPEIITVPLPETGSFDFFLEEDDKITSSLIATKCLTCGIHFTHPSYGEHIKTCCP